MSLSIYIIQGPRDTKHVYVYFGNCAIAMSTYEKHVTSRTTIREVIMKLLATCEASPWTSFAGGRAISQAVKGSNVSGGKASSMKYSIWNSKSSY